MTLAVFLATAAASDKVDKTLFMAAFGCFAISGFLVLITASLLLFVQTWNRVAQRLACLGLVLGLFVLAVAAYVHSIDFQPVANDGTQASPPLWLAILVPSLPVIVHSLMLAKLRRSL